MLKREAKKTALGAVRLKLFVGMNGKLFFSFFRIRSEKRGKNVIKTRRFIILDGADSFQYKIHTVFTRLKRTRNELLPFSPDYLHKRENVCALMLKEYRDVCICVFMHVRPSVPLCMQNSFRVYSVASGFRINNVASKV